MKSNSKNWLFIDFGSSGSKFLAYVLGLFYGGLIPSGVRSLYKAPSRRLKFPVGCGVVETSDGTFRVGEALDLCQSSVFKTETALVKICAILGSLLGDSEKSISLVLKLPAREFGRRAIFAKALRDVFKTGVRVNGTSLRVTIDEIYFHVEGSGLIPASVGVAIAVIAGHTDLSVVKLRDGQADMGATQTFHGYGLGRIAKSMGIPGADTEIAYAAMTERYHLLTEAKMSIEALKEIRDEAIAGYFDPGIKEKFSLIDWSEATCCPIGGGGGPLFRAEMPSDYIPIPIAKPLRTPGLKLFGSRLNSDRFGDIYGTALEFIEDEINQKLSDLSDPPKSVAVEVV